MCVFLTQREGNDMGFMDFIGLGGDDFSAPSAADAPNQADLDRLAARKAGVEALYGHAAAADTNPMNLPGNKDYKNLTMAANNADQLLRGDTSGLQNQAYVDNVIKTGGKPTMSDPNAYFLGGDKTYAATRAGEYDAAAAAAGNRLATTANDSEAAGYRDSGRLSAAQYGAQAVGQYALAGGLTAGAEGAAYQGQLGAANGQLAAALAQANAGQSQMGQAGELAALGKLPVGPSVAELSMRQASGLAQNQQASLAASSRGGNSALALQNAAANSAQLGGQLEQNVGIQRAQEDMANRTFAANAIRGAADIYGGAGNTFGGAGSTVGGAGTTLANAGQGRTQALTAASGALGAATTATSADVNANTALSAQASQVAQDEAERRFRQQEANDKLALANKARAEGLLQDQANLTAGADKSAADRNAGVATAAFANRDRTGEGTITGSAGGDKVLGAGASAASAIVGLSDIRAKKNIAPAGPAIDEMFRSADATAAKTRAIAPVDYGFGAEALPGYSYEYTDPKAPGAAPGQHFGPMAQDLEKTPAGASVVVDQGGRKGVDTGRLSLANASETARLRAQVDALMSGAGPATQIQGTQVSYPQIAPQAPPQPQANGYGASDIYNPWREDQDPRLRPFPGARA